MLNVGWGNRLCLQCRTKCLELGAKSEVDKLKFWGCLTDQLRRKFFGGGRCAVSLSYPPSFSWGEGGDGVGGMVIKS